MKSFLVLLCPALLLTGCVAVPYDSGEVYYPAPAISATISSGHHHYPRGGYYPAPYVYPAPVIVAPPGPHRPRYPGAHTGFEYRQPRLQDRGGQGWQYRDAPRRRDGDRHFGGDRSGRGDGSGGYNRGYQGR